MTHPVTWSDFYLICFAVGFCFSFFSFALGGGRTGRLYLPHFHGHAGGHLPSTHLPVAHAPTAAGNAAPAVPQAAGEVHPAAAHHVSDVSPSNFVTLTAFLAWF